MTDRSGTYSRVYHTVLKDPKFATIYNDNARFAWWVRLLIWADIYWPSPVEIPAGINRHVLADLVAVGLVDRVGKSMYRIHGLDSERKRRSDAARPGGRARRAHDSPTTRAPIAHDSPLDRPRQAIEEAESSTPLADRAPSNRYRHRVNTHSTEDTTPRAPAREEDESARYGLPHLSPSIATVCEEITSRGMGTCNGNTASTLDRLCEFHTETDVIAALRKAARLVPNQPPSWPQMVYGAMKLLEPIPTIQQEEPKRIITVPKKHVMDDADRAAIEELRRKRATPG